MPLSERDRKVLGSLELHADLPLAQVRKRTGLRDHSIRYALDKLLDRRIITRVPFIDIYPLGLVDYAIYFSIAPEREALTQQLLVYLERSPMVSWLAVHGGNYQYGMAISAQRHSQVTLFLDRLGEKFPDIIVHKALSIRVSLTLFSRKYLVGSNESIETLTFGNSHVSHSIDEKDHYILRALQNSGTKSLRNIADSLDMAPATLAYRMEQLRRKKVLRGFMYQIDSSRLGLQSFRLLLQLRGMSTTVRSALFDFSKRHPHVCYLIECLGNWDFEIGAEVSRGEEMVELTQNLYRTFGNHVGGIQMLPLFAHRKICNYPFQELPLQ